MKLRHIYNNLAIMLYFSIIVDYYVTYIGTTYYGFQEGNPLLIFLFNRFGAKITFISLALICGVLVWLTMFVFNKLILNAKRWMIYSAFYGLLIRTLSIGVWMGLIAV